MCTLIQGDSENSNGPIDFFSRRFSGIKPMNLWLNFFNSGQSQILLFSYPPKNRDMICLRQPDH